MTNKQTIKKQIMKKLLVIVLIVTSSYAFSQVVVQTAPPPPVKKVVVVHQAAFTPGLRLNVYTMYAFDDKVDSRYSATEYFYGTIKGGFQWGGGLEYMMIPDQGVELSYLRLDSNAPMQYYDRTTNREEFTDFDVATNYVLIGSNRYFGMNPKVEPFGGLQAGMAIISATNPKNGKSDTTP